MVAMLVFGLWIRQSSAAPPALGAVALPAALDLGVWGLLRGVVYSSLRVSSGLPSGVQGSYSEPFS